MAYMTYEEYVGYGGTLSEDEFKRFEPQAEVYLDGWTLNRLRSDDVVAEARELGEWDAAMSFLAWLVGRMDGIGKAIDARAAGERVTSFGNGVVSLGFAAEGGSSTAAEETAYQMACRMLPVSLLSACAEYNDAR